MTMAQAIREDGERIGKKNGKKEKERQDALGFIRVLEEAGWTADRIVDSLMESLNVPREKADEYMRESVKEKNSPS